MACKKSANHGSKNEEGNSDVTAAVEDLLNTLSNKLSGVSSEIFAKSELEELRDSSQNMLIDEISGRNVSQTR